MWTRTRRPWRSHRRTTSESACPDHVSSRQALGMGPEPASVVLAPSWRPQGVLQAQGAHCYGCCLQEALAGASRWTSASRCPPPTQKVRALQPGAAAARSGAPCGHGRRACSARCRSLACCCITTPARPRRAANVQQRGRHAAPASGSGGTAEQQLQQPRRPRGAAPPVSTAAAALGPAAAGDAASTRAGRLHWQ